MVISRPASEELAAKALRSAGWRTYLPLGRRVLRGRPDRSARAVNIIRHGGEIVERPVFAGYLFAEVHQDQEWSLILDARGVADVLKRVEYDRFVPRFLSNDGIEQMRTDERAGVYDEPRCRRGASTGRPDLEAAMRAGPVSVSGIEIGGHPAIGTLERLDESDRAIVRVMIFGREVPITVEASRLEVVAP